MTETGRTTADGGAEPGAETGAGPASRADAVRRERVIEAPAERIYRCWTEPAHLEGWFVDRAEGTAEPGGTLSWGWDLHGGMDAHRVEVAEPGRRLVLAGGLDPAHLIEVELESLDGGRTLVRIVHSGFGDGLDAAERDVGSGWAQALVILDVYVREHFGEARRDHLAVRALDVSHAEASRALFEPDALARWLTREPPRPAGEGPVRWTLADGTEVEGVERRVSGTERVVEWPARDAVLELKCWGTPDGAMAGARIHVWGDGEVPEEELERAADRLASLLGSGA